jgi:hypothetical protein
MNVTLNVTAEHIESAIRKMQLKENRGRSGSICPTALAIAELLAEGWYVSVGRLIIEFNHYDNDDVCVILISDEINDFELAFDDYMLEGQMHDSIVPQVFQLEVPDEYAAMWRKL